MAAPDMDVIKDIPGYKVILKAIIKSQIQQLVEQLAAHTDEESVILTASVSDGTLSHLGSESGKGFLEEQEDVKSHFLGFCLKRHHKQKQAEKEKERLQALTTQTHIPGQMDMGPGPRRPRMPYHGGPRQSFTPQGFGTRPPGLRHEPYHVPKNIRRPSPSSSDVPQNPPAENANFTVVKSEPVDENSGLSSDTVNKDDENTNSSNPNESAEDKSGDDSQVDPQTVKVESISETEFELEITGVEPGVSSQSMPQDTSTWEQNVSMAMSFDPSIGATGSLADMSSQQGYSFIDNKYCSKKSFQATSQLSPLNLSDSTKLSPIIVGNPVINNAHAERSFLQHICPTCNKICSSKWKLQTHIRTHTGEKPFKCEICERCFNVKGNLKSHMLTHSKTPD